MAPPTPALLGLPHLWLSAYARVALVVLLCAAAGYPLARRATGWALRAPLSVISGAAVVSAGAALLGWAHLFRGAAVLLLGAAVVVASTALLAGDLRRRSPRLRRPRLGVLVAGGLLAVAVLGFSVLTLYSYFGYDSTSYHLPMAQSLIDNQRLVDDPSVLYSFFPQANEALFAVCLLLSDNPVVTHGFEYALFVSAIALVATWFVTTGRSAAGALAAGALMLASPMAMHLGTTSMVEPWILAMLSAALVTGLLVIEDRATDRRGAWLVIGVCAGAAAAAKYTGIVGAAVVVVAILLGAGRSRLGRAEVGLAVAGALAMVLPWYAKPIVATGDPLYPYLTSILGNRAGHFNQAGIEAFQSSAHDYVDGWRGYLQVQLDAFQAKGYYEIHAGLQPLSPLIFVGFGGLLLRSLTRSRVFVAAAASSGALVLLWLVSTPDQRYPVAMIGLLGLTAGLLVDEVWGALGPRIDRRVALLLAPVLVAATVSESILFVKQKVDADGWPAQTAAADDAYLAKLVSCYHGVQYLNTSLPAGYTAYELRCEEVRFYARGTLLGARWGPDSWDTVVSPDWVIHDPNAVADQLRGRGIGYLVTPAQGTDVDFIENSRRFEVVYSEPPGPGVGALVFRVLPPPA